MVNPGKMLLQWWRNASVRARWFAGIVIFSSLCTVALVLVSDSVGSTPADSTAGLEFTPWDMLGVTAKLLFVLALIAGSAVALRKFTGKQSLRRTRARIEVVETVRISPRQALHVVRAGSRYLLVGATDQALSLITDLGSDYQAEALQPAATEPAATMPAAIMPAGASILQSEPPQTKAFEDVLSSLISRPKE